MRSLRSVLALTFMVALGLVAAAVASAASTNKNLVLIQGTKADNFYVTMGCGAQAEAKKLGYNISVQGPASFAAPQQIPIVQSVTATKPAAVMIAPTDEKALIAPMQAMKSAGIKVIQVDTTVSNTSMVSASISSDNQLGGKLAADYLAKSLGKKGGSVVVMNEQPGVSTTEARIAGFVKEIKKFKNIKLLKTQFTGDNPAQAASTITSLFSANQNLGGVFATNVLVAEGTDTGLKNAGVAGKVKIVGYDADPEQVTDLKKGVVQALIAQEPFQEGVDGVQQAVNAIKGKPTKSILTKLAVLTKSNLAANSKFIYKSRCWPAQSTSVEFGAGPHDGPAPDRSPGLTRPMIVVAGRGADRPDPDAVRRPRRASGRRSVQHRALARPPRACGGVPGGGRRRPARPAAPRSLRRRASRSTRSSTTQLPTTLAARPARRRRCGALQLLHRRQPRSRDLQPGADRPGFPTRLTRSASAASG